MGGKSSTPQTTTQVTQAQIPEFLMPFLSTQASAGQGAITGIQDFINNSGISLTPNVTPQVAPMNANQTTANNMVVRGVTDPNGVFQNSINGLRSVGQGQYINRMLPVFDKGITNAIEGEFIPGSTTNTLEGLATNPFQLDPVASDALRSTAAGANLYGTPAFDAAVNASIRAARPNILSGFAGAGRGAVGGGLAQAAVQRAASDAFASLYNQERDRQLGAASSLGNFQLAGRGQQADAATSLGSLNLQQQGLRNQAIGMLGSSLNQERDRQVGALQTLPGVGLLGSEALANVGAREQGQAQAELDAQTAAQLNQHMQALDPLARQQLLLAATQGLPIGQLIGQSSTQTSPLYRNRGAGILGGAATGAGIGQILGLTGTGPLGWAALGGGLLGGFL